MLNIKRLDWDSDFFGKEIGILFLEKVEVQILSQVKVLFKEKMFDLVYIFEKVEYIKREEELKSFLMDTKIVFKKNIQPSLVKINNVFCYESESNSNVNQLYELAYESGKYSRFRIDPKFNKMDFFNLYKKWVDNSINNILADSIFLYKDENDIIGFVTVQYFNEEAKIGLIAVSEDYRGRKIGSQLLAKVEYEAAKKGCSFISVATQFDNLPAYNFYQKNSYQLKEITNIYHVWK